MLYHPDYTTKAECVNSRRLERKSKPESFCCHCRCPASSTIVERATLLHGSEPPLTHFASVVGSTSTWHGERELRRHVAKRQSHRASFAILMQAWAVGPVCLLAGPGEGSPFTAAAQGAPRGRWHQPQANKTGTGETVCARRAVLLFCFSKDSVERCSNRSKKAHPREIAG